MSGKKSLRKESGSEKQPAIKDINEISVVIPRIEEKVDVGKKLTETSKVRINKKIREEEVIVDAPSFQEEVEVKHVEVNKYVEAPPPAVRYEGDTMIIPVLHEVVEKRLLLKEEVHITKRKIKTDTQGENITLRKEEINVAYVKSNDDSGKSKEQKKF